MWPERPQAASNEDELGLVYLLVEVEANPGSLHRLVGHVEHARRSASDPAFGTARRRPWARSPQGDSVTHTLRDRLKGRWERLTDEDLDRADDQADQLLQLLQDKYEYPRHVAEHELLGFLDQFIGSLRHPSTGRADADGGSLAAGGGGRPLGGGESQSELAGSRTLTRIPSKSRLRCPCAVPPTASTARPQMQ